MPLIEWNESLSVGIDAMDAQHKKWIEIINELDEAMLNRRTIEALKKTVQEMEDYTSYHFREEEKLMESLNYPDLANHKKTHENFEEQVQRLKVDLFSGEIILGSRVMKTIINWLQAHIANEDKRYGRTDAV